MDNSWFYAAREQVKPMAMRGTGRVFEALNFDSCRIVGAWLGAALHGALKSKRTTAISNIRVAFPHLSYAAANQIARRASINFGMTFAEFSHLPHASAEEIRAYCPFPNIGELHRPLEQGKGVILMTAHLGNWEVLAARATQELPVSVIIRPNSNPGVQAHIDAERAAIGMKTISKYDGGRLALRALRDNRLLAIMPDQHAGPEGLLLPMFGQPTKMVTAVGRIALLSGAPVLPVFGVRRRPWLRRGRIDVVIRPSWYVTHTGRDAASRDAAVEASTIRGITELEHIMTAYPDQWLWLHRRWRAEDGAVLPA